MAWLDLTLPERYGATKHRQVGYIGDYNNVVDVPDRPGWIYVRAGSTGGPVRRVFDGKRVAPRVVGAIVYYEEMAHAPGHYQVVDLATSNSAQVLAQAGFSPRRFEYGGADAIIIDWRQIKQGLVTQTETPSMRLRVGAFCFYWDGALYAVEEQQLATAITAPATGYARWDRVGIDVSTLLLDVVTGTPGDKSFPELLAKPTIPADFLPLADVLIYDTTTALLNGANIRSIQPYYTWQSGSGYVPTSRSLTAGAGLSGGGDLSADRTFNLDVNDLTAESTADDADYIAIYDVSASATRKQTRADFLAGAVGGSAGVLSCGRLTLQSGNALPSLDITGATTLYWTPYRGNRISFYDGSAWQDAAYAEASASIPATTNTNYDVYLYDNAGSLAFDLVAWRNSGQAITNATNATPIVITANAHGLSNGDTVYIQGVRGNTAANGTWVVANVATNTFELVGSSGNGSYTSGTGFFNARSVLPTLQDGIWVKTGATGRRLWGAIRTTSSSGQCEDSLLHRFCTNIWNYEMRPFYKNDTTGHTYTSATYRWWNNSTTHYIDFVQALDAAVYGSIGCTGYAGAAGQSMTIGISMDKGTLIEPQFGWGMNMNTQYTAGGGSGAVIMMAGYHFLAVTEAGGSAGSYFNQYQLKGFILG